MYRQSGAVCCLESMREMFITCITYIYSFHDIHNTYACITTDERHHQCTRFHPFIIWNFQWRNISMTNQSMHKEMGTWTNSIEILENYIVLALASTKLQLIELLSSVYDDSRYVCSLRGNRWTVFTYLYHIGTKNHKNIPTSIFICTYIFTNCRICSIELVQECVWQRANDVSKTNTRTKC